MFVCDLLLVLASGHTITYIQYMHALICYSLIYHLGSLHYVQSVHAVFFFCSSLFVTASGVSSLCIACMIICCSIGALATSLPINYSCILWYMVEWVCILHLQQLVNQLAVYCISVHVCVVCSLSGLYHGSHTNQRHSQVSKLVVYSWIKDEVYNRHHIHLVVNWVVLAAIEVCFEMSIMHSRLTKYTFIVH